MSLEVERVDHVYVVEIGCGSLIGDVDGMLEGQIPDREGLEFCISGLDATPVLVV